MNGFRMIMPSSRNKPPKLQQKKISECNVRNAGIAHIPIPYPTPFTCFTLRSGWGGGGGGIVSCAPPPPRSYTSDIGVPRICQRGGGGGAKRGRKAPITFFNSPINWGGGGEDGLLCPLSYISDSGVARIC